MWASAASLQRQLAGTDLCSYLASISLEGRNAITREIVEPKKNMSICYSLLAAPEDENQHGLFLEAFFNI